MVTMLSARLALPDLMNAQVLDKSTAWHPVGSAALIRERVEQILRAVESTTTQHAERRRHKRYPFPHLLTLTPVGNDALKPIAEPMVVVGKDLSVSGLHFYHRSPLPYRRAIVSFDDLPIDIHLLMIASWCRFLRPEWYDSGGKFTHLVTPGPVSRAALE
jgi:hypothetical protein